MKIAKVFYTIAEDIFVFTMGPEGKSARKAPGGSPYSKQPPAKGKRSLLQGVVSLFYTAAFQPPVFVLYFGLHFAVASRNAFSTNAAERVENARGGSGGPCGGDSRFSITIISRHFPNL